MMRSPGLALDGEVGEVGEGLPVEASAGASLVVSTAGRTSCVPGLLRSPTWRRTGWLYVGATL